MTDEPGRRSKREDPYELERVIQCEECEHSYDQLDGEGQCGYCAGEAFELVIPDEEPA